jgi:hypothetical protein
MNIEIEFIGFPVIYDLFPEGCHPHSFAGNSIPQLVGDLVSRHGQRLEEALRETRTGMMDPTIQIRVNGKFILQEDIDRQELGEGDQVAFLKLLAGG